MTDAEIGIVFIFVVIIFWGLSMMAIVAYVLWAIHQDDLRRENETRRKKSPAARRKSPRRTALKPTR